MNLEKIQNLIKECQPAVIVAATKYISKDGIRKLSTFGIKNVGENRVEALLEKYDKDIDVSYHFIGHLQRNKAKKVANIIDVLHSLDSYELALSLNKLREKPLDVFIEVKLTNNENKSGISPLDLEEFLNKLKPLNNINVIGLMTMTDPDSNDIEKDKVFKTLNELKNKYHLTCLSMGMSDDYKLAIKNHSTHIRLGRILFEEEDFLEEFKHYLH